MREQSIGYDRRKQEGFRRASIGDNNVEKVWRLMKNTNTMNVSFREYTE